MEHYPLTLEKSLVILSDNNTVTASNALNHAEVLPSEIFLSILQYLDFNELLKTRLVSHGFKTIADDPILWQCHATFFAVDMIKHQIKTENLYWDDNPQASNRYRAVWINHVSSIRAQCLAKSDYLKNLRNKINLIKTDSGKLNLLKQESLHEKKAVLIFLDTFLRNLLHKEDIESMLKAVIDSCELQLCIITNPEILTWFLGLLETVETIGAIDGRRGHNVMDFVRSSHGICNPLEKIYSIPFIKGAYEQAPYSSDVRKRRRKKDLIVGEKTWEVVLAILKNTDLRNLLLKNDDKSLCLCLILHIAIRTVFTIAPISQYSIFMIDRVLTSISKDIAYVDKLSETNSTAIDDLRFFFSGYSTDHEYYTKNKPINALKLQLASIIEGKTLALNPSFENTIRP